MGSSCCCPEGQWRYRRLASQHLTVVAHCGFQWSAKKAENWALDNKALVNQSLIHAELIASFRRAEAEAAHKFGLLKVVAKKGPMAIQAAVDTAAKAAKRRDSYAKKLEALGLVAHKD